MRLPFQAPAIRRSVSTQPLHDGVSISGCNRIACAVAVVTCGAACLSGGGTAGCLQCLASIGATGCADCF